MPVSRRREDGAATRQRIEQLERLVKDLISERTLSPSGSLEKPSDTFQSMGNDTRTIPREFQNCNSTGKTVVDGTYSVFHGGNDWHLVLQEVFILSVAMLPRF